MFVSAVAFFHQILHALVSLAQLIGCQGQLFAVCFNELQIISQNPNNVSKSVYQFA